MEKIKPYLGVIMLCMTVLGSMTAMFVQFELNTNDIAQLKLAIERQEERFCPAYKCELLSDKVKDNKEQIKSNANYLQRRFGWRGDNETESGE